MSSAARHLPTPPPAGRGPTLPMKLATGGATVAVCGFVASHALPMPPMLASVLAHASEGAFVGFVCDVFAVTQVYAKARENFHPLVEGVSDMVVDDFIQLDALVRNASGAVPAHWQGLRPRVVDYLVGLDLRAALLAPAGPARRGILAQPAVRDALSRCTAAIADDSRRARSLHAAILQSAGHVPIASLGIPTERRALKAKLEAFFDGEVKRTLAEWLGSVDARPWLVPDGQPGVMDDAVVRRAVAQLLRTLLADKVRVAKLDAQFLAVFGDKLPLMVRPVVQAMGPVGTPTVWVMNGLEATPSPGNAAFSLFVQDFARAYLDAWHELPGTERTALAERVLERVVPGWIETVANGLATHARDWTLAHVLGIFLTPETVQAGLRQMADALLAAPTATGAPSPLAPLAHELSATAGAWLDAWHALPETRRRVAVEQFVDALAPPVLDTVGSQLAGLEGLGAKAKATLQETLVAMGPDAFVQLLRARTQEHLDWIKVNGVVLGAVLGGGIGVLDALLR